MANDNGLSQAPQSAHAAEAAVLGAMLRDNTIITDVGKMLTTEDFYLYPNRLIFDVALALHREGSPVDLVTIASRPQSMAQIRDDVTLTYLAKLWDAAPAPSNWPYYAGLVRESATRNKLTRFLHSGLERASQPDGPLSELLADLGREYQDSFKAQALTQQQFPPILSASELHAAEPGAQWIWEGCLALESVTLLSALWKAGKTTLLSHLIKALAARGEFCGMLIRPATVLYVTEESGSRWAERRDELGLGDHVRFLIRPFVRKPSLGEWHEFIEFLGEALQEKPAELIVFDTLGNLWPVRDENNACEVQEALMLLRKITQSAAILLVHHLRKNDGQEATGTRGSGALPAFVDTILELRRFKADDRQDRQRVLQGYGRWDNTPEEIVVELRPDGSGYVAHGNRQKLARANIQAALVKMLPNQPPGLSEKEIVEQWAEEAAPRRIELLIAIRQGIDDGTWLRDGKGVKGDPFRFWVPNPTPG